MKKLIALTLALLLALSASALAEKMTVGVLSLLNITEQEYAEGEQEKKDIVEKIPELEEAFNGPKPDEIAVVYYDTLDALLMGLQAGDVDTAQLPKATGDYLCARNDNLYLMGDVPQVEPTEENERELRQIVTGFSFLMLDSNAALRDEFDAAIAEMKDDGTMAALLETYILDAVHDEEQKAVAFDNAYAETVRVAVTGALPPMDYVAPDGTYAGFNTAVLAEIGKRVGKNIELVQTDSMARAAALASGTADVVFWTRVATDRDIPLPGESEEHHAQHLKEGQDRRKGNTGEEDRPPEDGPRPGGPGRNDKIDMPVGTVVTDPYYVDYFVFVAVKAQ